MRVLLSEDFNKSGQLDLHGAMSKGRQRSPDRLDWDNRAADALERARLMPPGPKRNEALKLASLLRCIADARLLCFIEAIEVAFPRDAPRIFLGVSSLRRQRSKDCHDHCNRRVGRKSHHLNSDQELGLCMSVSGRKTQVRVWIFSNMPILKVAHLPRRQAVGCVHGRAGHFMDS